MELKVQLEGDTEKLIDHSLQATLLKGAVQYILKELTPDRMEKFVEQVLMNALKDFRPWDIQKLLEKEVVTVLAEEVKKPEVMARVRTAALQGLDVGIAGLPEAMGKEVIEAAKKGVEEYFDQKRRRY